MTTEQLQAAIDETVRLRQFMADHRANDLRELARACDIEIMHLEECVILFFGEVWVGIIRSEVARAMQ